MKNLRMLIEKRLGRVGEIATMLGFKNHQRVSNWFNSKVIEIPYHFAIQIAYLTGIGIEKIAPYAKEANAIISEFLFKKSLPQFNSLKIEKPTIEPTSKLGKRIIMTDENVLLSGYKVFKKTVKDKNELKRVVILPINEVLHGSVNLNIFEFSNIEKLLIATYLKKVLKQNFVFTNATVAKMIMDIIQVDFEELPYFEYLTKYASKNMIECVDLGVISVFEAYGFIKEAEAENELETINRQQYADYCPRNSIKRIQNIILHVEFGCAI